MNTFLQQLHDAVDSLDVMIAGGEPNRTLVITGALGLNSLCDRRIGGQTVIDAATVLTRLAIGGAPNLDGPSRLRYEQLADGVRRHVSALESIEASQAAYRHSMQRAVTT